jgi:AcrR family transcriptional regulator
MAVNEETGGVGHTDAGARPGPRRTQAERSASTRAALLGAARRLFAEHGFAATGREEIVDAAGVTRGALYHHFDGKEDLFRAVYEQLEIEIVDAVVRAASRSPDPMAQLRLGTKAYLEAAGDPAVQRVMLIDAPSVLGYETRRRIAEAHGLGLVREVLRAAMAAGAVKRQPVEPLAHLLLAALHEAALFVAQASDQRRARREVGETVDTLLAGLAVSG